MALGRPGQLFVGVVTSNTGAGVSLPVQGCHSITVRAAIGNTGVVYIGDATVDETTGFPLIEGESLSLSVSDANVIYHMANVDGQSVNYLGVT